MASGKTRKCFGLALMPALALSACAVAPPSGPTVVAMPGQGKSLAQFQQDDASCRNYAQSKTPNAGQASANAQNSAATSAVAGTLIGAAAGAALGAIGGNAGLGAGIGAGVGLAGGAAAGSNNTQAAADSLQGSYDVAYAQCMVANGETIQQPQAPVVYAAPPPPSITPPHLPTITALISPPFLQPA